MKMYVFDTYALIEIVRGNKNYLRYTDSIIIINKFILAEFIYWMIRDYGMEKASIYIEKYRKYVNDVDYKIIISAMRFRYKHKKKKLSMTDCISYFMAKNLGVKFLTGDQQFQDLENVEYVK